MLGTTVCLKLSRKSEASTVRCRSVPRSLCTARSKYLSSAPTSVYCGHLEHYCCTGGTIGCRMVERTHAYTCFIAWKAMPARASFIATHVQYNINIITFSAGQQSKTPGGRQGVVCAYMVPLIALLQPASTSRDSGTALEHERSN